MKVVTPQEMGRIEKMAYQEGCQEEEFMNEAGKGVASVVDTFIQRNALGNHIILLCGKGNNGGDAYKAGKELLGLNYEVFAFQLHPIQDTSPLCQKKHREFLEAGGKYKEVKSLEDFSLTKEAVFIDGLFGTGFKGEIKEPYASLIEAVNLSKFPVIAVDIPSGLNGETGEVATYAIKATETAFLGLPKTGFFLKEAINFCGILRYVDFGLPEIYINQAHSNYFLLTTERVRPFLPAIPRSRHKYSAGHVTALSGSYHMPGAAILSATATLRGGAGITHLLHPKGMDSQLSLLPPEIIRIPYTYDEVDQVIEWMNKATACYAGPGLGREKKTAEFLKKVFSSVTKPIVIDGDALSLTPEYNLPIPKNAVLTPHTGEMHRLLGLQNKKPVDHDLLEKCQKFAEKHEISLVLKGAITFVFYPKEKILINATSDPGMATAGSGDVLTGLIAALLAQKLPSHQATALGVHLHGLAGLAASLEKTSYSMIASDIIDFLPEAFQIKKW